MTWLCVWLSFFSFLFCILCHKFWSLCSLNLCFLFFSPPKPSLFLFWLLPSSPLSFLYFLTLSGLVSCVTGNVTVSVFFPLLSSLLLLLLYLSCFIHHTVLFFKKIFSYNFIYPSFYLLPKPIFMSVSWSVWHCTSSVLRHISPEKTLNNHLCPHCNRKKHWSLSAVLSKSFWRFKA